VSDFGIGNWCGGCGGGGERDSGAWNLRFVGCYVCLVLDLYTALVDDKGEIVDGTWLILLFLTSPQQQQQQKETAHWSFGRGTTTRAY